MGFRFIRGLRGSFKSSSGYSLVFVVLIEFNGWWCFDVCLACFVFFS